MWETAGMAGWNENEQGAGGWRRRLGAAAAGAGEDDGAGRGGGGGVGMGAADRKGFHLCCWMSGMGAFSRVGGWLTGMGIV